MTIKFVTIIEYLDVLAADPQANDAEFSPHKFFWRTNRDTFVSMKVPNVNCKIGGESKPISVVVPGDPDNSPIYNILLAGGTVCGKPQMPGGGPYLTDASYRMTLPDGSAISGLQVLSDLREWIQAGCPE